MYATILPLQCPPFNPWLAFFFVFSSAYFQVHPTAHYPMLFGYSHQPATTLQSLTSLLKSASSAQYVIHLRAPPSILVILYVILLSSLSLYTPAWALKFAPITKLFFNRNPLDYFISRLKASLTSISNPTCEAYALMTFIISPSISASYTSPCRTRSSPLWHHWCIFHLTLCQPNFSLHPWLYSL